MLSTTVELSDVYAGLRGMQRRAADGRTFFRELKPFAKQDIAEHGKKGMGPTGPWPGPAKSTVERRGRRKGYKRLGRIPRANQSSIGEDHLKLTNAVKWADAHRTGATVGNGAKLPEREFMYFSEPFLEDTDAAWHDHVLAGWGR